MAREHGAGVDGAGNSDPSFNARGQVGYPSKEKGLWTKSRGSEEVYGGHLG